MLEVLALSAHLLAPPDPDWSAKKHMLRARLAAVVHVANLLYSRDDEVPRLTLARLPGRHGQYDHDWKRLTLDLESVHDPVKFWHVYRETVPHEWAHALNGRLHAGRGHDDGFAELLDALQKTAGARRRGSPALADIAP